MKKISIVIPAYKAENTIERTVRSVLSQKSISPEVIVVEDGVFDNTQKVLEPYKDKINLVSLEKNAGAQYARNKGLSFCNSEYVMFLDADDYLEGDILFGLYTSLDSNSSDIAFGNCITLSQSGKRKNYYLASRQYLPHEVIIHRLTGVPSPGTCSTLWRKKSLESIGGWNEAFAKGQDVELLVRAVLNGLKTTTSQIGAGIYWQHEGERVSRRVDFAAFESHERLYQYIKEYSTQSQYQKEIIHAMNYYCAAMMAMAFKADEHMIYNKWKARWKRIMPKISLLKHHGFKVYFLHTVYYLLSVKRTRKIINILKGGLKK